jgi:hypothetical protein
MFQNISSYLAGTEFISLFVKEIVGCLVRSAVLSATSMKMGVFSDAAPCCLVKTYRRFREAYCLHHQGGT